MQLFRIHWCHPSRESVYVMSRGSANQFLLMTNSDERKKPALRSNSVIHSCVVHDKHFKTQTHLLCVSYGKGAFGWWSVVSKGLLHFLLLLCQQHLCWLIYHWQRDCKATVSIWYSFEHLGWLIYHWQRDSRAGFLSDTRLNTSKRQDEGKSHIICFAIKFWSQEVGIKKSISKGLIFNLYVLRATVHCNIMG